MSKGLSLCHDNACPGPIVSWVGAEPIKFRFTCNFNGNGIREYLITLGATLVRVVLKHTMGRRNWHKRLPFRGFE